MNDRPTAVELLAAARGFLETELIPTLADARIKFQTLVTANVLAIVERELQTEEDHLRIEWSEIAGLSVKPGPPPRETASLRQAVLQYSQELCERIRRGEFDESNKFLPMLSQLRASVVRKLKVANPRYLADFAKDERLNSI